MQSERMRDVVDEELVDLLGPVPLLASKAEQVLRVRHDRSLQRCRRDRHVTAPAKLEQPLVAQDPQRAENGVPFDAEHGREIACRWQPLPGFASPSAMARRISPATWSWTLVGSSRSTHKSWCQRS